LKITYLPPQLKTGAIVCFLAAFGCVNRGQHTPMTGGTGGTAGAEGIGGHGGSNVDASVDLQGAGGSGGAPDCVPTDGGATDGDADASGDAGSCNSTFNFENCATYGAAVSVDMFSQMPEKFAAFTSVFHSDVALCGQGALGVAVEFSPTKTGGEVRIPVAPRGAVKDYSGQTITVSVKADKAGTQSKFYVLMLSTTGYVDFTAPTASPPFGSFPFQTDWMTRTTTLSTTDLRLSQITDIVLQATGPPDGGTYTGTIYVDEIDIRKLPGDGGGDGASPDGGAPDVRDAGAGDARDAPAGS
jgi:hypothetical protein